MKKTKGTFTVYGPPDAWHALVLRSMGIEELRREIANPDNTEQERAAMRDELKTRENKQ